MRSLIITLFFLIQFLISQSDDRLKLLRADILENIMNENNQPVQYLKGDVKFKKGEAIINSDEAYYIDKNGIGIFVGNVSIVDEEKIFKSDSIKVESKNNIFSAYGSVTFDEKKYKLESDSLIFYSESDSGIAFGKVEFQQDKQTIFANKITYLKELNDNASYQAEGNVKIINDNGTAICGASTYDALEKKSILSIEPSLTQNGQILEGENIELYYENDEINRLFINNNAHVIYKKKGKISLNDSLNVENKDFIDDMSGNSLEAYLKNGEIDSVRLQGMAITLTHLFEDSIFQGKNIASGDTISLNFKSDSLDKTQLSIINVMGGARGEYEPDLSLNKITNNIIYSADTIKYNIPNQTTNMNNSVIIDYGETTLESGFVKVMWKDNIMTASSGKDKNEENRPKFIDKGRDPLIADSLTYNLSTGQGKVNQGRTKMDQGYYKGAEIRNREDNILLMKNGIYTTCENIDHPHFHFGSKHMKVILNELIVARPLILHIFGIPVFGIPFAILPDQGGKRHSGWIMPAYGQSSNQGRYLRGLGYFWAVNEYLNSRFTLNFYDKKGVVFENSNRYFKRYSYNGNFNFKYNRTVLNNDIGNFFSDPGSVRWSTNWTHSQILRKNQSLNINGSYYSDSQFNQKLGIQRDTRLNQSAVSNATYSKRWPKSNISFSSNISQNTNLMVKSKIDTSSIYYDQPLTENRKLQENRNVFPTLNFRKGQSKLFNSPLYFSYNSNFKNNGSGFYKSYAINDSTYAWGEKENDFKNSWIHNFSLSGTSKILKYISLRPRINFREEWITQYFDADSIDSNGEILNKKTINEFKTRHVGSLSLSTNTKIYGLIPINIGGLKSLRHTITPSIGFSYRPDFTNNSFGYVKKIYSSNGNSELFDPFQGSQIGSTPSAEQKNMNISVKNLFQAKIKEGEEERKIDNLLTWNINTSYNFAAEQFKLSQIRSSFRSGWLKKMNLDISMTHDFYKIETINDKSIRYDEINKTELGIPIPRLLTMNAATGFKFSGNIFGIRKKNVEKDTVIVDSNDFVDLMDGGIEKINKKRSNFSKGENWNLNVSLRYSTNRVDPINPRNTFWANSNLSFRFGGGWQVRYNARLNLIEKDLVSQDINIYKTLHCWEMNFTWTPTGYGKGFYFRINVKAPTLRDIKLEQRGGRWTGPGLP